MNRLHLLSVASEVYPLIKTGGLADVAGALPAALAGEGVQVVTLLPGYPAVMGALEDAKIVVDGLTSMSGTARLIGGRAAGLDLLVLDAPHLYDRPGNPYVGPNGQDWPDNGERFAALTRAAAEIGHGMIPRYRPDVIHAHDWQAALVPAYQRYTDRRGPPVVLTVHNLAFQGRFPPSLLARIGLPEEAMTLDGVEYYGDVGFLKAGILFADRITTVSPSYAAEIATDEGGMGLGGLLRGRSDDLVGILNGIDLADWNPAGDPLIPHRYDAGRLKRKARNKAALRVRMGLADLPEAPIFGIISRLTTQKGLDVLADVLPSLCARGLQFALLGTGDNAIEAAFAAAGERWPEQVACEFGYDEPLAHLIQAGADALVVPSRFEPCGLTQLAAMRYGTLPVVARTGGLADSVIDANVAALRCGTGTGFMFAPVEPRTLERAVVRAAEAFAEPAVWERLQRNAMALDVGWSKPARAYAALYRALIAKRSMSQTGTSSA
jgi:starch synthase